jgi:hypothetical protein
VTRFPLLGPDATQHSFQQIVRTVKGTLLAMGPVLLRSTDDGRNWTAIDNFPAPPDGDNAEGRYLTALADGGVLVTWGVGHDNRGLRYNLSPDDGQTWDTRTVTLLPDTPVAARYYSARTIPLDGHHFGSVFMNAEGVHFLKAPLDRLKNGAATVAQENWPAWRGPTGQGHSSETDLPLTWSASENVRWKVELPAPGNSTPIVWGDHVFITQPNDVTQWPPKVPDYFAGGSSAGGHAVAEKPSSIQSRKSRIPPTPSVPLRP